MDDVGVREALATAPDRGFELLVLLYQDRLYRFALRLAGNRQDAEEIAQDAFVRAYRALQGYSPERIRALAWRPWLYQISLNVFRNRVRRRQLAETPLILDESSNHVPADEPLADNRSGPESAALAAEWCSEIAVLLARLPERQRIAVILRHVEGLSYRELAVILDQPIGTIKANVHRGVAALRAALIQCDDVAWRHAAHGRTSVNDSEESGRTRVDRRRARSPQEVT